MVGTLYLCRLLWLLMEVEWLLLVDKEEALALRPCMLSLEDSSENFVTLPRLFGRSCTSFPFGRESMSPYP
jgi:hypothetical protein